jgi:hypothetical protein
MIDSAAAAGVSSLIQTALAPMFLLSAIGTTLSVIDTRLNRIVDRARDLETRIIEHPEHSAALRTEADYFLARAQQIAWAVALCTTTALAVAAVVILIFVDLQTTAGMALYVEIVFTAAVVLYVGALLIYLRDVFLVGRGLEFVRSRLPETGSVQSVELGSARP